MPDFIIRSWTKEHLTDFNDFVVTADTVEAAVANLINSYDTGELEDLIKHHAVITKGGGGICLLEAEGTNRSTDGEAGWSFVDVDNDVVREVIINTDSNYSRTERLQPRHVKINMHGASDVLSSYVIVVHQLVTDEQLLRSDDRLHNPKGTYIVEDVAHEEMALDVFHALIPIGCLDDFSITVSPLLATLNPDLVERQKQSDIDRNRS